MSAFQVIATLLTIAAAFAYVNHRWLRLPATIGLMTMSLTVSLLLIGADKLGWVSLSETANQLLSRVDFNETLLHGMLGALLFAGALHVDFQDLRKELLSVAALALGGTVLSTFLVGAAFWATLAATRSRVDFATCLLFGALISPTDPIAVIGALRRASVPKALETQIAGESLFNDGIGVVVFVTVLGVATRDGPTTVADVGVLFLREAVGGALFGLATGWIVFRLVRSIDHYQTELLLTIALVLGGYALAEELHVSAPIAAVVSGLVMGNSGRSLAMSDVTRDHLDKFWSLVDDILNSVLFLLIGFEIIHVRVHGAEVLVGAAAIAIVLVARLVSVALPLRVLRRWRTPLRGSTAILTWGGLRGGISVALALSLPEGPWRGLVISTTYVVVVFSVLVQGLTLGRLAARVGCPPS